MRQHERVDGFARTESARHLRGGPGDAQRTQQRHAKATNGGRQGTHGGNGDGRCTGGHEGGDDRGGAVGDVLGPGKGGVRCRQSCTEVVTGDAVAIARAGNVAAQQTHHLHGAAGGAQLLRDGIGEGHVDDGLARCSLQVDGAAVGAHRIDDGGRRPRATQVVAAVLVPTHGIHCLQTDVLNGGAGWPGFHQGHDDVAHAMTDQPGAPGRGGVRHNSLVVQAPQQHQRHGRCRALNARRHRFLGTLVAVELPPSWYSCRWSEMH